MEKCLEDLLHDLPEDLNGPATTPSTAHLFDTHADAVKLSDQDQDLLHTWVAKLLFLSKRAIPLYESAMNRLG